MGDIDIGAGATDRNTDQNASDTLYSQENPANDTGALDSFEGWAVTDITNCKMGTASFSGNDSTPTDSCVVGDITAGSKQTFNGLDCDVNSGDYLGVYCDSGNWEEDSPTGGGGYWYNATDQLASPASFLSYPTRAISIYATGSTPSVGGRRGTQVIIAGM